MKKFAPCQKMPMFQVLKNQLIVFLPKYLEYVMIFWKLCSSSTGMRLRILGPSMRKSKKEDRSQRSPVLKASLTEAKCTELSSFIQYKLKFEYMWVWVTVFSCDLYNSSRSLKLIFRLLPPRQFYF